MPISPCVLEHAGQRCGTSDYHKEHKCCDRQADDTKYEACGGSGSAHHTKDNAEDGEHDTDDRLNEKSSDQAEKAQNQSGNGKALAGVTAIAHGHAVRLLILGLAVRLLILGLTVGLLIIRLTVGLLLIIGLAIGLLRSCLVVGLTVGLLGSCLIVGLTVGLLGSCLVVRLAVGLLRLVLIVLIRIVIHTDTPFLKFIWVNPLYHTTFTLSSTNV